MKTKFFLISALLVAGCTSINVKPVPQSERLQHVCIVNNPKVIISDFISILQDGFSRHNITTSVVENEKASSCEVTLTYTALRSWDITTYLYHAELRLWRQGRQIGAADYHLRNKGGLDLSKWRSTRTKMGPVIDKLLGGQGET
ncbi:MAG: Sbal_3080 family lipoprotein [Burkholderiaceae bacterium]|jgi:hypothetical protein|nr:Sbal_3080 family lipoprotein [Burkholderiaceae bacterium]